MIQILITLTDGSRVTPEGAKPFYTMECSDLTEDEMLAVLRMVVDSYYR